MAMLWRISLGDGTLYVIRDGGSLRDPLEYMIGSTDEAWSRHQEHLTDDGLMDNAFTCYLFDNGTDLVMVDTGFGANAPDGLDAGHMPAALERLGVAPTDIDHVVFTHLHPDHILGSLTADGQPWFENAVHWTVQREVDFWRAGTDERSQGIADVADALDAAGVLRVAGQPGAIAPGVDTFGTFGHTPGHVVVRVESRDEAVVITGDLTFSPAQVEHPDWAFPLDVDRYEAAASRAAFFDELAVSGTRYAAGHYAQPALGKVIVTSDGRRYEALPVAGV